MKRGLAAAALLVSFLASIPLHDHLKARRAELPPDRDRMALPSAEYLPASSVGYREALADLIWVRAILFVGEPRNAKEWQTIQRALEAITLLSPTFRRPYLWGSTSYIYNGEKVIRREMIDRALDITRQGVARFPEDHELLFILGMLLTRDVATTDEYSKEEKAAAREEGIAAIRRSAAFGAPPIVRQYAATLVSQGGDRQLAISFLEGQLLSAQTEDHRRLILAKLAEIGAQDRAGELEQMRLQHTERQAQDLPYVDSDLYVLLAPPQTLPTSIRERPVP